MMRRRVALLLIYLAAVLALRFLYESLLTSIRADNYLYHEVSVLIVFALVIPAVAVFETGRQLKTRGRIIRFLLLSGIGVLVADVILPEHFEIIIQYLQFFKIITIVPGLIIEFFIAMAIYRVAFSDRQPRESVRKIEEEYGVPTWLAKGFVIEANFWRRIYRFFSGTRAR